MNPTPEQIEYVKNELARGVSEADLKSALTAGGYSPELIAQIWTAATGAPGSTPTPALSELPEKKSSVWKTILIILAVIGGLAVLFWILISMTVLSSLSGARDKGEDAATKSQLNNFRAQAELYFDGNDFSYAGVCAEPAAVEMDCLDSDTAYRVSAELNNDMFYCVDSVGNAGELAVVPAGTTCEL